jgi:2-succinyl-6-hydroxy-2,4-cyclohexadiene-1-carboxylate synthase
MPEHHPDPGPSAAPPPDPTPARPGGHDPAGLAADRRGHAAGPRLVAVHGFTQTRRCWGVVGDDLALDHDLVLVDAPGHGGSASIRADLRQAADRLVRTGGSGTYLGYSMGGRLALRAALDHPDVVRRLVLVGASPGLADPDERAARRAADDALADRIEHIGVAAFLDEWLALPLFAGLTPAARCLDERLENTAPGLADSLRRMGTGAPDPLWDRLGELADRRVPVLLVTGALDTKFTGIAQAMRRELGPTASTVALPGVGHTAHLEDPPAFLAALRAWAAAHPLP